MQKALLLLFVIFLFNNTTAQKVDSVRIYFDQQGNQSTIIFTDSLKPYNGKLNLKEVSKRIAAVSGDSPHATMNNELLETVELINKEILAEAKKSKEE